MISLPALLILIGLVLLIFTGYGGIGLILLIVGLILALVGVPFGWYSRGAP